MLMLWSKPTWLGTRKAATKPSLQARWRILHLGHSPRHAVQRISLEPGRTYALLRDVEYPYCKGERVYGSPWNKTQPVGAGCGAPNRVKNQPRLSSEERAHREGTQSRGNEVRGWGIGS